MVVIINTVQHFIIFGFFKNILEKLNALQIYVKNELTPFVRWNGSHLAFLINGRDNGIHSPF